MSVAEFHFLRPYWLLALLPLIGLVLYLQRKQYGLQSWAGICDESLLPYVLVQRGGHARQRPWLPIALVGLLGILALAGPTWKRLPQPVFQRKSALVIALDLSLSMEAEDIQPSRLLRARFKIADILQRRNEGQTALIAFAERAFTVAPLTDDTRTLLNQLPVLAPEIMPAQGSRPDRAVDLAAQLLQQAGAVAGDILLITDGVESGSESAFREAISEQHYRVSVLAVGTRGGAPIPLRGGGFVKSSNGEIILAAVDEDLLQEGTRLGRGLFQTITPGDQDIEQLSAYLQAHPGLDDTERVNFQTDRWYEQGPWLILVGLLIAVSGFRRGYLIVLLALGTGGARPAAAADDISWWWRPDQQAARALQQGDASKAEKLFSDPQWRGVARYRQGDFQGALQFWDADKSAEGWYNKGNALAELHHDKEAVQAYDQALALDPKHEDARYNRDLVSQRLQQTTPPSGPGKQDQQENDAQKDQQQEDQKQKGQDGADAKDRQESDRDQPSDAEKDPSQADKRNGQPRDSDPSADQQAQREAAPTPTAASDQKALADGQSSAPKNEAEQANEQWLRRVPDDPGGLLRRKFYYQYRQQEYLRGGGQGW